MSGASPSIREIPQPARLRPAADKWVPVINRDACTGCGLCIAACDRACLELVWDFATLTRPADCGSCGDCQPACPHGVIEMGWVAQPAGEAPLGRWREAPTKLSGTVKRRPWLARVFAD